MKILSYGLIILFCTGLSNAESLCPSGNVVVDRDARPDFTPGDNGHEKRLPPGLMVDTVQLLLNRDFETGSLPPWNENGWLVLPQNPHTGNYCAWTWSANQIWQNFTPTLTDSIVSITFWARQPQSMFERIDFLFTDDTAYWNFIGVQADWMEYDATSWLPPGKWMNGLGFWGYSMGNPNLDWTYIDDISVKKLAVIVKVEEDLPSNGRPELRIGPNPVRDRAVIEWTGLKNVNPTFAIYDLNGAIVERGILSGGKYVWSTASLVAGVYFIRIDTGQGRLITKEVLVVK